MFLLPNISLFCEAEDEAESSSRDEVDITDNLQNCSCPPPTAFFNNMVCVLKKCHVRERVKESGFEQARDTLR